MQNLVMLVDDSKIDLHLNKKFLSISGIADKTIDFLSASEALEYLKENAQKPEKLPSLILLDVKMPELNGFDFLEAFKNLKHELINDINIIMLSSTLDPNDIGRAHDNTDVQDMLRKPLNPEELKKLIEKNIIRVA